MSTKKSCAADMTGTQLTEQVWYGSIWVCSKGAFLVSVSDQETFHFNGCQDGYGP